MLQLHAPGSSLSPYDSPEVRRVLAPILIDRACSPMPDSSTQPLPLPEILTAVRQQLLEPWAAQQLQQAQSQGGALSHLQALPEPASEAEPEAAMEAASAGLSQVPSAVDDSQAGHSRGQLHAVQQHAERSTQSPDAHQLQLHDDTELGQMHSTADLEAASEAAGLPMSQAAQRMHELPAHDRSSPSTEPSNLAGPAQSSTIEEEAEETTGEFTSLHAQSRHAASAARSLETDSNASSNGNDMLQPPSWHEQWQGMQQQQLQKQEKGARPYSARPSELMTKLAAASMAEQLVPIRAVFEHYSKDTILPESEQASVPDPAHVIFDAAGYLDLLQNKGSGIMQLPAEYLTPAACAAGEVAQDDSRHHAEEEDVHAVEGLPDEPELHAEHAEQQFEQKHGQHIRHGVPAWDAPSFSKRTLVPATEAAGNDSSGDTSPEAARNSRMKVRRTSGEYQQVLRLSSKPLPL